MEVQLEVAAFCKVLRAKCDDVNCDETLLGLKTQMKLWMGNHILYVMAISDQFTALKTVLMQICQDASI